MIIEDFLTYLSARNLSPNTIAAYRSDLLQFQEFLRRTGTRITGVTPKLIQSYMNELTGKANSARTVWRKLASISSFYQFLRVQSDGRVRNPVSLVLRPKFRRQNPSPIEDRQLAQLLDSITDIRDRALILLFLSSGLRLAELLQLNRDSIQVERKKEADGRERVIGVGTVIGKGNKQRTFLTDVDTLAALAAYLRTRRDSCPALFISNRRDRLSRRETQHILEKWCKRAGLPRFHVHSMRHSYATRLANAGIPAIILKELMGHASFETTQGYFRIKRQRLAAEYFAAMENCR